MTSLVLSEVFKYGKKNIFKIVAFLLIFTPILYSWLIRKTNNMLSIDASFEPIIFFINICIVIFASGLISLEFEKGTIKNLLIQPNSRVKILYSKYITLIMFILIFYSLFITGVIIGGFTIKSVTIEYNWIFLSIIFKSIILASISFLLSLLFKSTSKAVLFSLILIFLGEKINSGIEKVTIFGKYTILSNYDFSKYFTSPLQANDLSIYLSICIVIIHFLIFNWLIISSFTKSDI